MTRQGVLHSGRLSFHAASTKLDSIGFSHNEALPGENQSLTGILSIALKKKQITLVLKPTCVHVSFSSARRTQVLGLIDVLMFFQ